jgi:hypothetical protein
MKRMSKKHAKVDSSNEVKTTTSTDQVAKSSGNFNASKKKQ